MCPRGTFRFWSVFGVPAVSSEAIFGQSTTATRAWREKNRRTPFLRFLRWFFATSLRRERNRLPRFGHFSAEVLLDTRPEGGEPTFALFLACCVAARFACLVSACRSEPSLLLLAPWRRRGVRRIRGRARCRPNPDVQTRVRRDLHPYRSGALGVERKRPETEKCASRARKPSRPPRS